VVVVGRIVFDIEGLLGSARVHDACPAAAAEVTRASVGARELLDRPLMRRTLSAKRAKQRPLNVALSLNPRARR
jgi:hypothetical protein